MRNCLLLLFMQKQSRSSTNQTLLPVQRGNRSHVSYRELQKRCLLTPCVNVDSTFTVSAGSVPVYQYQFPSPAHSIFPVAALPVAQCLVSAAASACSSEQQTSASSAWFSSSGRQHTLLVFQPQKSSAERLAVKLAKCLFFYNDLVTM